MNVLTPSPSARAPLGSYLGEIDRTPLLSAAQEKHLAGRVALGDPEARDHLVRANLRLVVYLARMRCGRGLPLEDLVEDGNLGLLRAAESFDASWNARFSTYAKYWINQSMKRGEDNTARTIRIPAYMVRLLDGWGRATNQLADELGRPPTPGEVGRRLGLPKKQMSVITQALRASHAAPRSYHSGEDGRGLDAALVDDRATAPGAEMVRREDLTRAMDLLGKLGGRGAAVLRMRFGLDGEEPKSLQQIGARLGLTRERARQIEGEALTRLRDGWPA